MNLEKLIDKNGPPQSLIFSLENNTYYAIWGFDDVLSINIDNPNLENSMHEFQKTINDDSNHRECR